ncbi:hypothetical protein GOV08_03715, partial [Candidatus Woesearchaeota archaeon]|nr:hypothetical protein [Candidatus Woesearchaeota archaeon]
KDISVEIKSLLTLPINVPINFLEANTTSLIYKTTLLPAEITTSKSITFDAVVNYTTEFGVQKSEDEQWKITLKPLSDILIEKKISPSSVEEGDEVTITVSVKNTRSKPIYDIQLHEIVPEEISRNGKTSAVIEKLDDDEKQDAYEYTINAPKVKNETIITLNTSLTYSEGIGEEKVQQQGFAIIKSLDIKVKPKKLDLDIDKNIDKTKMYVGEIAKVTYSIENKDEETAYDLLFEFTKSKDVDLLEEYDYYLERLEPGELVSFDREVLRPKVDGKYVAGQTIVHFKDPDKNSFNYTISSPTIDVKERNLWGPGIILEKSFEKTSVDAGEIINVTITAQNVGDEEAFANIVDGQREWRVIVPVGKKKNITYKVRVFEAKDAQTDAFAYHDFQGKEYRAYAKSPGITVKALEAPVEDEEDLSGVVVAKTVKEKEAEQLRGFFKTFWEMLKSFIGIKKA